MRRALPLALATALLPTVAFAHTRVGDTTGFLHGFEHPIGGLDHILAMVAVGLFAYVLGGRTLWLVPAAFVGMMVVGFARASHRSTCRSSNSASPSPAS